MRRILGALVASVLAVAGLGIGVPPVAHAAGGTISGIVTDSAGLPIPGATLVLMNSGAVFLPGVSSDATGRYTFTGVGPSTWRVVAQAPGFAIRFGNSATVDAATTITITSEEVVDFPIVLPRKTAAIAGRVTDPSGAPVAGAVVNLQAQERYPFLGAGSDFNGYSGNAVTDADGRYRITDLAPTPFVVSCYPNQSSPNGPPQPSPYLEEFYPNKFVPADAVPVPMSENAETSGIDAQLDLGATISGIVTDPAGNPVANAGVYTPAAMFSTATTDASGRYTIIGVPPGTAQVAADGPFPSPWLTGFYGGANWDTAAQIPVALGQVITGIDIQLPAAGTVDVTVIRADGSLASPRMTACVDPATPFVGPVTFPGFAAKVECTSGGVATVYGNGRLPAGTYNAVGDEGAGMFGNSVVALSGVANFVLPADGAVDCVFILGGAATCGPADPATRDGDGVAAAIEDRAPNGGDGNADGIRDATQGNVVSLPAAVGGGYATVAVASGLQIESVNIMPTFYVVTLPIVTGAITVSVKGLPVGGTADITVIDSNGGTATEVRALSQMNYSVVAVPAELSGTAFTAHIADGGVFDQSISGPNSPPNGEVFVTLIPVITGGTSLGPNVTCPSPWPTFALGQFATVYATVTDNGGGVAGPPFLSRFVDTSRTGSFSVQFTATDLQGNSTTVSCPYTVMDDGDGVPYADESFDVNGDTIIDGLQANVAPAVGTFGETSVYFVSHPGTQLSGLRLESARSTRHRASR